MILHHVPTSNMIAASSAGADEGPGFAGAGGASGGLGGPVEAPHVKRAPGAPDTDRFATAPLNRVPSEPDALRRVPLATYRLQLGAGMTFADAAELCDYLTALGISDVYTSPLVPLYLGRTAAFVLASQRKSVAASEALLEDVGAAFERQKPYLVERWS